ncbi:MAG: sterol desaturase family protein, partial [Myxococcales bacterium]|nr:sterol desaturase family protein [Myxococcales bacterium]
FHAVHHSAEHLDWLAAHREHPVDGLYTMTLENLPALLLGFRLEAIAGFVAFRGVWAVFIHSNVRLPLGPLKVLFGSPELHHWHHDAERGGTCNFANLSPLMDKLFGTYYAPPGRDPAWIGTPEKVPHDYLGQLAYPLAELGRDGVRAARAMARRARGATPQPEPPPAPAE